MIDPKAHHALALAILSEFDPGHPAVKAIAVAQDLPDGHVEVFLRLTEAGDEPYTRVLGRFSQITRLMGGDEFANPLNQIRSAKAALAELLDVRLQ